MPSLHLAVGDRATIAKLKGWRRARRMARVHPRGMQAYKPVLRKDVAVGTARILLFFTGVGARALRLPAGLRHQTRPAAADLDNQQGSDSCGIRTHALADWRLKPAP